MADRLDAARQLFVTCAATLVFFSLFALWHGESSGAVGEAVSSKWAAGKALIFSSSGGSNNPLTAYSSHQCIGGEEWTNDGGAFHSKKHRSRRCHFRNVCARLLSLDKFAYDTSTNETIQLTYYRNPLVKEGTEIWSKTGAGVDEPWLMTDRDHFLRVQTEVEPMPKEVRYVETPTVLMGSFWPLNFGHALGDDLFPAFRLLRQFDLLRSDNYYAYHQSCQQRGAHGGCKNAEAVHAAITTRPYQKLHGELFPKADEDVCFADLVMGPNALTMREPDERAWPDMVHRMKQRYGIRTNRPLKKHKVVVVEKHGRRTWLNYPQVREHIEETYGVETLLVNPASLTIGEQLKLFEEVTVMFTPPGGVSFSSMFLHPGASAIFVEYWDENAQRSYPMDQEVYVANPDMHPLFYPLKRADLSLNRDAVPAHDLKGLSEMSLWQTYSNVTIDLDRLDTYLRDAFVASGREIGVGLPPGLL